MSDTEMSIAARDVLAERKRQIEVEGHSAETDDTYTDHQLVKAAVAYALHGVGDFLRGDQPAPKIWPWGSYWWKPTTRRRNLEKAGALIIAAIEQLDRKERRELGDTAVAYIDVKIEHLRPWRYPDIVTDKIIGSTNSPREGCVRFILKTDDPSHFGKEVNLDTGSGNQGWCLEVIGDA